MTKHDLPKVIAAQFRLYAGMNVIPLNRPTATRTKKGKTFKIGKAPLDFNWTKKTYDGAAVIARCIAENRNMGLRLGPTDLVIDVDLRHGGKEGFAKLKKDLQLDDDAVPRVDTGSGGFHLYGKKPAALKINTKLEKYPGVEFKTAGSQVVAAGSIHPETLRPYVVGNFEPFSEMKIWPANLLALIERKPRASSGEGAGVHTPEQLASMLCRLNAEDFKDHDRWRDLMFAAHHGTDGDGIEEFVAWSTSDPEYADDADLIRVRWNSLATDKANAITAATLYKALTDAGAQDAIPRNPAADFQDDVDVDAIKTGEDDNADPAGFYAATTMNDLLKLPSPKWIIRGLLIERGLYTMYGKYKTGKTFWAIEMACCIATGHDFFDLPVTQGKVLYVIAEGSRKLFAYRLRQWCHERAGKDEKKRAELLRTVQNIGVVPVAVLVDVPKKVKAFLKDNPGKRTMVFIDTAFRSIKGDIMNSQDTTKFIAGCAFIQRHLDSALLFLHHQKRTEAKGAFGSVVTDASVDGALKVSCPRQGQTLLSVDIMRDADAGVKPWLCTIKVCPITDMDLSDEEVKTTGVLVFEGRGKGEIVETLQAVYDHRDEDLSVEAVAVAIGKTTRTADRHLAALRAKGWINAKGYELTPSGLQQVIKDDDLIGDDFDDEF